VNLDLVPEALATSEISIGWPLATELLDKSMDYWQFRDVVKRVYYAATRVTRRPVRAPLSFGASFGR